MMWPRHSTRSSTRRTHGLEPEIRKNLSFSYYESGHMVYIDEESAREAA